MYITMYKDIEYTLPLQRGGMGVWWEILDESKTGAQ